MYKRQLLAHAAGGALHLNAGEHRNTLADHLGRDGDGAPADQVTAARLQPIPHRHATVITQDAAVIAKQSAPITAARYADVLLDCLFAGHCGELEDFTAS